MRWGEEGWSELWKKDKALDERYEMARQRFKKNMKWTQKERIMSVRDYFLITGLAFNT